MSQFSYISPLDVTMSIYQLTILLEILKGALRCKRPYGMVYEHFLTGQ